ncbi:hypothetical protein Pelo_9129 [Pelomyxa schiedti]|nr:hypothetical protein Pelo_9129 [Pelomyxa schiedti]
MFKVYRGKDCKKLRVNTNIVKTCQKVSNMTGNEEKVHTRLVSEFGVRLIEASALTIPLPITATNPRLVVILRSECVRLISTRKRLDIDLNDQVDFRELDFLSCQVRVLTQQLWVVGKFVSFGFSKPKVCTKCLQVIDIPADMEDEPAQIPRIDTDVLRRHLMPIAVNSPSIATFTMHKFGITIEEVSHHRNPSWQRCGLGYVLPEVVNSTLGVEKVMLLPFLHPVQAYPVAVGNNRIHSTKWDSGILQLVAEVCPEGERNVWLAEEVKKGERVQQYLLKSFSLVIGTQPDSVPPGSQMVDSRQTPVLPPTRFRKPCETMASGIVDACEFVGDIPALPPHVELRWLPFVNIKCHCGFRLDNRLQNFSCRR